jgi:hypothetical protein
VISSETPSPLHRAGFFVLLTEGLQTPPRKCFLKSIDLPASVEAVCGSQDF